MQRNPKAPPAAAELRRGAEARLKEQHPETAPGRTEADTQRLVHELQVHQIELEMQNEELEHARDEMEAGLEKYTELYDFAPVGYLTLDHEGTIHEANLTAARLLGLERSRLMERSFQLCVSPLDRPTFQAFLTRVFEGKAREFCELTLVDDGKPPIELRIGAVVAASGHECRAMLEDITEHKRAWKDRLILNKLESTGILAGGIAHDFNNLLTVILVDLELAQALNLPGEDLASFLNEAKKAALTARDLTQQLITFADGGMPARKPIRLAGLIQDSVRTALSGSRLQSECSLADDLWPTEVDAGQIGQVIRNLVLNAREAMPQGGVVSVRAKNVILAPGERSSLPSGDYVRVSIADQGDGIAREVLPKIFDPYFSTKDRGSQKGMGLGLTICHNVIQRHGGAVAVESTAGVGTTFNIYLPASGKEPVEDTASGPEFHPHPVKILVMDDEEDIRKALARALQGMGHVVETAKDGQMAIEIFQTARSLGRPFDAVLLDLTVRGGTGGREALRALLKIDPAVKGIIMSGYSDDPAILAPDRDGFKGVLRKPFDPVELRQALGQIMQQ